ncbi:MAG: DNA-binding HxlR family transcriptional regulator [Myxococcota bacterium]|jgi:DNA-binding HxlR family transcriptional regulator
MTSDRKCYGQRCPMAMALDVVGERWTLLILRELLGGAARYNQLLEGLPGIARNLLSARLRRLEEDGIVERVKVGSATAYALTELGTSIRPTLEALGFWGARLERIGPAEHDRSIRAIAMALQAILVHAGGPLPDESVAVELIVGGEAVEIVLGPRPLAIARSSPRAAAQVQVSRATMSAYLSGESSKSGGFVHVSGDPAATEALVAALRITVAS